VAKWLWVPAKYYDLWDAS